uniref:Methionine-gamma-lyase n=1 Tax=Parachlorella kessleri TaxID=3074 RepID=A0A146HU31_PARKE|nr:methionine-gamma-lyase [Parachlorella kessleri]
MEEQRVATRPLVDQQDPMERLAASKREFGEFGGVNAAVEVATTFTGGCYLYGRSFNPTVRHLGRQLAALEGAEAAYCCSSGMAAISSTLLALCNSGDHIVASNAVYGGTFALLKDFLPRKCGISTSFVPIADLEAVRAAITPATKVIYAETLSNPTLVVADLPALAEIAHSRVSITLRALRGCYPAC